MITGQAIKAPGFVTVRNERTQRRKGIKTKTKERTTRGELGVFLAKVHSIF